LITGTTCPSTVSNGNIASTCSRRVDVSCSYICSEGYLADRMKTNLKCQPDGTWDKTDVCKGMY